MIIHNILTTAFGFMRFGLVGFFQVFYFGFVGGFFCSLGGRGGECLFVGCSGVFF